MTREDVLREAIKCVCESRESEYGSPENNFNLISSFWSDYLGTKVSPVDVSMMMALLKIARIKSGRFKEDSFVDGAGYMACGGEIAFKEIEKFCSPIKFVFEDEERKN